MFEILDERLIFKSPALRSIEPTLLNTPTIFIHDETHDDQPRFNPSLFLALDSVSQSKESVETTISRN